VQLYFPACAIDAWFAAAPGRSADITAHGYSCPYALPGWDSSGAARMTLPDILRNTWMLQRSNALDEKAEIPAGDGRAVNVLVDAPSQWIE
jgi:hypothetical protein